MGSDVPIYVKAVVTELRWFKTHAATLFEAEKKISSLDNVSLIVDATYENPGEPYLQAD